MTGPVGRVGVVLLLAAAAAVLAQEPPPAPDPQDAEREDSTGQEAPPPGQDAAPSDEDFVPSERIPADASIAFPVDI